MSAVDRDVTKILDGVTEAIDKAAVALSKLVDRREEEAEEAAADDAVCWEMSDHERRNTEDGMSGFVGEFLRDVLDGTPLADALDRLTSDQELALRRMANADPIFTNPAAA